MTVDRGGTSDLDIFNYFFFFRFVASNFKGREMKPVEESVIQGRLLSGFFFLHTRAFLCGFNIFRRDQAKNTPFYCSGLLGKKAIPTTVLTHIHKYIYIDMFSYIFPPPPRLYLPAVQTQTPESRDGAQMKQLEQREQRDSLCIKS